MKIDLSETAGKTLGELLIEMRTAGIKDTIFVGSQSGYFLIGTLDEVIDRINSISDGYKVMYESRFAELRKKLEDLINSVHRGKKEPLDRYANRLETVARLLKVCYTALPAAKKRMDTFVNMADRSINDFYYKEYDPGIAIIIDGFETGDYWTSEEWNAVRHDEVTS